MHLYEEGLKSDDLLHKKGSIDSQMVANAVLRGMIAQNLIFIDMDFTHLHKFD